MNKRDFLLASATGAVALPLRAESVPAAGRGPALLTVTGAISRTNRGPLDPVLDQMMAKQKLAFDKAHAFDFATLDAMPKVTIKPTLEYDKKVHALTGPLLANVLKAVGVPASGTLAMRAVDGYAPTMSIEEALKYRFIVATHLDGRPMPLGGLGPLWAVYEADKFADMAAKPVEQRFEKCPWGLYHIEVKA